MASVTTIAESWSQEEESSSTVIPIFRERISDFLFLNADALLRAFDDVYSTSIDLASMLSISSANFAPSVGLKRSDYEGIPNVLGSAIESISTVSEIMLDEDEDIIYASPTFVANIILDVEFKGKLQPSNFPLEEDFIE